jgi:hypothetical protein
MLGKTSGSLKREMKLQDGENHKINRKYFKILITKEQDNNQQYSMVHKTTPF